MRQSVLIVFTCVFALVSIARATAGEDSSTAAPPVTCANGVPGGINCIPSKEDLKHARDAYARGLKLQSSKHYEKAFEQFDEASHLVPDNLQFLSARELLKSQLVFEHTARGNALLADSHREQAVAEFRAALNLDPDNQFAQQRLEDATRDPLASLKTPLPELVDSGEIHLQPKEELATFHYGGDVRGLFTQLASAYGITVEFDDSVATKQVRFNVDNVDFFTALSLANRVSKTMWTPLDSHQMLIAADNAENHRQYDRMSLGTFIIPASANTQQDANQLVLAVRTVCDFQKVTSGNTGTFDVRAPAPMLRACTKLLQDLTGERPEVMLDVRVYSINHNFTRNIGLHIPYTFNLFNIPVGALAALGGQNIQSLINQLISSGGINQAGSSALSALLAQLQGQANSIFSQPLATFGGGLTFSGLSLDKLTAALSLNESWAQSLEHMTIRSSQGQDATFHLGTRYPILNASYAPIYNSPQISQVLGNQSYIPPFPSVSYEDLGLNLKAKPIVHSNGDISMSLEMQVRSLTGQSSNGVPVISNREFKGSLRLSDGEPAIVAGEVSHSDQRSMNGLPLLGQVPLLSQAALDNNKSVEDDELLIVITPHVLSNFDRSTGEIWVSEK
jgi:general secretion pathway protein D